MTTKTTTCPSSCSFTYNVGHNERYPIRIDVEYDVHNFIDEAMWRTARIKDSITDQCERMRREGELSEEQVTYQETFDPDIEDFHIQDYQITFHFGYERRCGFITHEGPYTAFKGTDHEHQGVSRDRCVAKEQGHARDHDHDFEPYPTPPPNEG